MNLKVGKYYTLDIEAFDKKVFESSSVKYFGIDPKDIEIFKNNKPHKCVFAAKSEFRTSALYFKGQKKSNIGREYKRDYWLYNNSVLDCFKEYKPIIQEEMEV